MHLIHGYLGYNNYGDELLAALVEKQILKNNPFSKVKKLSSKNNLFDHISFIASCKVMICVGGLFQDSTSKRSPFYYMLTVLFARLLGKKVKIVAQGVGPLKSKTAKFFSFWAFRLAHEVSVRDKKSSEMLTRWKIDHYQGSDLAWLLDNEFGKISNESKLRVIDYFASQGLGQNKNKYVAVSLKNQSQFDTPALINKVSEFVHSVDPSARVLILNMQDCDIDMHRMFVEADCTNRNVKEPVLIEANNFEPSEILYILRNYCSEMIGMRLHALILAKLAGLDVTAIACDPKIEEFKQQTDLYTLDALKERAEKHFMHAKLWNAAA